LKALANKYDFVYPEYKLLHLSKEVKWVVDDKAKYTDWSQREDIKAELKMDLIILLAENDYPSQIGMKFTKKILNRLKILNGIVRFHNKFCI
jgi:hypothetical protein